MTYCVAMSLDAGMIFASDSRTNAGVDQIARFSKMKVFAAEGQRVIVTLSSGNLSITQNALNILHEIGRDDIKVIRGASAPLCRKLEVAPSIHGESGLEGATLLHSPHSAIQDKPFLQIYNSLLAQPEKVEFVVTGAMTNLAILLRAFPDIKEKINGVTIMGGAIGPGNWSPAAEFNILVDP